MTSASDEPLLRALRPAEEDTLVCAECLEQVSDYIAAETNGQAAEARWDALRRHLQQCPHCAAIAADLLDLARLADAAAGPPPGAYPGPDLRFLRPPAPPTPAWRLDELGRLIIHLSTGLLDRLRLPPPAPGLAWAGHKSAAAAPHTRSLTLSEVGEDLEVTIMVTALPTPPERAQITIEVRIPSRGGWPNLADSGVTMLRRNAPAESQLTDAFGKAVFSGVAIVDLEGMEFVISPYRG